MLRDHPSKARHDIPNWPPLGTWIGELENIGAKGEIGVLNPLIPSRIQPVDSFLSCIDYEDSS
jgi:hypothetical protein